MTITELRENIGNPRGHFTTKENRAAKLASIWDELKDKFTTMIQRGGGNTDAARHAYATLLMMETGIRIGNESSAEGFICDQKHHALYGQPVQTFGLTTLLHSHVTIHPDKLTISFTGKKLVEQNLTVTNPILVAYVPSGIPDDLFLGIEYNTLKQFIRRYVGVNYTPKDLRTAKVNLTFCDTFGNDPFAGEFEVAPNKSTRKKVLATAIDCTAQQIGHTISVCRSSYLSKLLIQYITERLAA